MKMKNLCAFALTAGLLFFAGDAMAEDCSSKTGFFGEAACRFMNTFQSVRTMVLIFGGFGLIVLAVAAILGKIKWAALGALAAGLAIVAVAGKVVDYATKESGDENKIASFTSGDMDMKTTTTDG